MFHKSILRFLKSIGCVRACLALLFHSCLFSQAVSQELTSLGSADDSAGSLLCPTLESFYSQFSKLDASQADAELWLDFSDNLMELMPACLGSSEYFALLGAARLGAIEDFKAIEALERSLLLDPSGGAARVDYAQALYNVGQLFPAIEMNAQLLSGEALPSGLRFDLEKRAQDWRADTRQRSVFLNVSGGYGNNLNGAPGVGEIMLTLSGEPVTLSLSDEFQSISGPYGSVQFGGQFRWLAPSHQHDWVSEVRERRGADKRSDILQFQSRYSFTRAQRARGWRAGGRVAHVSFGGNALFSSAGLDGRYQLNGTGSCNSAISVEGQRQHFSQQRSLDALEARVALSLTCGNNIELRGFESGFGLELGLIGNQAIRSNRPGGNRDGWQLSAQWQGNGYLMQFSRTTLDDSRSYSPILAGGASRSIARDQVIMQHRRPFKLGRVAASLHINFFHREQESNIKLFSANETAIEIGLGFVF